MDLYIGNVPPDVTPEGVRRLFDRVLLLPLKAEIPIGVVRVHDATGKELTFVYSRVPSKRLARTLIKRLNGRRVGAYRLVAREFHHRATCNERRAVGWRSRPWHDTERRQGDRRCFSGNRVVAGDQLNAVPLEKELPNAADLEVRYHPRGAFEVFGQIVVKHGT